MKLNKRPKLWVSLILVVSVVMALGAGSCNTSQYKTFTLKQFDIHFSCEYPASYKIVNKYTPNNPNATIGIRFAPRKFLWFTEDPVFGVNIGSRLAKHVDPVTAAERAGSHTLEQRLERTSLIVADVPAEMVIYSSKSFNDAPSVNISVFLEAEGRLWNIFIYSRTEKAEEAKQDFGHIISTFEILP
jgi:hypothetical protein